MSAKRLCAQRNIELVWALVYSYLPFLELRGVFLLHILTLTSFIRQKNSKNLITEPQLKALFSGCLSTCPILNMNMISLFHLESRFQIGEISQQT